MGQPQVQLQARMGSSRLPGKALLHLGHARMVESVYQSCSVAEMIFDVILVTGDDSANDALVEWAERHGISYFVGSESNLLKRHRKAAEDFDTDPVVRVCGDSPFIIPSEIDRIVSEHNKNDADYTTNVADDMPGDTSVDVIDREVLDELAELGDTHPIERLRKEPERWNVEFSSNPNLARFQTVGTDVDTPTEYWRLFDAVNAVGSDPFSVREYLLENV